MVTQGSIAPDFTLETDRGAKVTLSQIHGKQVVLFFYSKDDTPVSVRPSHLDEILGFSR